MKSLLLPLMLALAATLPAHATGATTPSSIASLLEALPELPTSAAEATTWVDRQGRLVHKGWLGLEAAIDTHRHAVARISQADAVQQQRQGTIASDNLMQGMADVGIDVQRLQTDPAYQRQVQERIKRMTPAEQMAMAQRMNAPLNNDRRYVNAAQAMAEDLPAARVAAEAGFAYAQEQVARMNAQHALWQETEDAVKRVLAKKLNPGLPKPRMEFDNPGCDKACQGQWHAYAAKMLPLMLARDSEVLQLRRATLAKHRALVIAGLKTADQHLQATQFGAASRSSANIGRIVGYDNAAVAEIQTLLNRSADIVKRAAVTAHCGEQAVLVPGAVCY